MSPLRLQGSTSGYSQLDAPAVAGDQTFTLPGTGGTLTTTNGGQTVEFGAGSASTPSITATGDSNTGIYFPAADTIAFSEGGAEAARLDSSGRLLVGTSTSIGDNDLAQVHKAGGSTFGLGRFTSDNNGVDLNIYKSRGATVGANGAVSNNDRLGGVYWWGNNGSAYNIAASVAVEIDGAVSGGGANDMPGRLVFSTTADGASSPTTRMTIPKDGNTSISNSTAFFPLTDNTVSLGINGGRWSAVWAANGTIQTSDERAKSDVADAVLGADFIKSLRPVSYKWIEGGKRDTGERDEDNNYVYESVPGERTHWGFIAQEVKQAVDAAGVDFGGWVLTDKDDPDSQQALRYDQFIAPLTKALQEALVEIDALKAKVAALESA